MCEIWVWTRDIIGFISAIVSLLGFSLIGWKLRHYDKSKYQRLSIDMENFVRLVTNASNVGELKKVREQFLLLDQQIQVTLKDGDLLRADSESIADRLKKLIPPENRGNNPQAQQETSHFKMTMNALKPEIFGILLRFERIVHSKK